MAARGEGRFLTKPTGNSSLREKFDAARSEFKRLKQYCCCLVLYNCDKPIVLLVGISLNVITDSGEREH